MNEDILDVGFGENMIPFLVMNDQMEDSVFQEFFEGLPVERKLGYKYFQAYEDVIDGIKYYGQLIEREKMSAQIAVIFFHEEHLEQAKIIQGENEDLFGFFDSFEGKYWESLAQYELIKALSSSGLNKHTEKIIRYILENQWKLSKVEIQQTLDEQKVRVKNGTASDRFSFWMLFVFIISVVYLIVFGFELGKWK